MAAKERSYKSLPGRGIRRQGPVSVSAIRSRLWLAKDHLLNIDSQWYSEDYKRFYFRDIQAFMICKTTRGRTVNIVMAALAVPAAVAALVSTDGFAIMWWSVAGFFSAVAIINALYGPTCICHVKTAVQTDELPSLRRLWQARKVLARLQPLITEAQGQLKPEEISTRLMELANPAGNESATAPTTTAEVPNGPLEPPPGTGQPP
jgi:hypothetical protein